VSRAQLEHALHGAERPQPDVLRDLQLQVADDVLGDALPAPFNDVGDAVIGGEQHHLVRTVDVRQVDAHGDVQAVECAHRAMVPVLAAPIPVVMVDGRHEILRKNMVARQLVMVEEPRVVDVRLELLDEPLVGEVELRPEATPGNAAVRGRPVPPAGGPFRAPAAALRARMEVPSTHSRSHLHLAPPVHLGQEGREQPVPGAIVGPAREAAVKLDGRSNSYNSASSAAPVA
jgi:hypothetical protein